MAVDSGVLPVSRFNPLATNRLETRDDVISACNALFEPLVACFSPGKARVQIDSSASTWDRAATDLEGWARPLFGIVAMVRGGGTFPYWNLYREGLTNGTNASHVEFWGEAASMDQRHVEAAAIGLALVVVPQHIWEPLDPIAKENVARWLLNSRSGDFDPSNHMFFRVMVDLGLRNVGIGVDQATTDEYLCRLEGLYIDDGWYGDKETNMQRIDYYIPWAMHYYGLLYAYLCPQDRDRAWRFRERARLFAQHFQHWFADSGSNVPYGRSLVYRHCVNAFWGALALNNVEALPWGVMRGLYLRNLRWWSTQPISRNDGLLTLGYSYPNQFLTERYCSPGSPYWAMKAFAPLALPASNSFWSAEELPIVREPVVSFSIPGMVFVHQPNHTVLLVSGPEAAQQMRGIPEKYLKFAYSSRFGFSIESDPLGFDTGAFDSMLAFSDDRIHFRVREHCADAALADNMLYSQWHPWSDVKVETWLIPRGPWHFRIHRIFSPRDLFTTEGGFAAPRTDFDRDQRVVRDSSAYVLSRLGDFSGIIDFSSAARSAKVCSPHGNTNVLFPRTLVPQLHGLVPGGVSTVFMCGVLADPDGATAQAIWLSIPDVPSLKQCEAIFARRGVPVKICSYPR